MRSIVLQLERVLTCRIRLELILQLHNDPRRMAGLEGGRVSAVSEMSDSA